MVIIELQKNENICNIKVVFCFCRRLMQDGEEANLRPISKINEVSRPSTKESTWAVTQQFPYKNKVTVLPFHISFTRYAIAVWQWRREAGASRGTCPSWKGLCLGCAPRKKWPKISSAAFLSVITVLWLYYLYTNIRTALKSATNLWSYEWRNNVGNARWVR